MPKRVKESRPSSRHSGGRFSPPPPPRQSRNDYQVAGPSLSMIESSSGRRSPHSNDTKISNGNTRHGNSSNRALMSEGNSPIVLTDDDDDDEEYKNLDPPVNIFREHGSKMKLDTSESTGLVKHFVASVDRYHIPQSNPEKPMFRGPETDVLHDLEKDKLKNIRVQMIRADVQQNESFRKAYVIEEPVASRSKGDKNHQSFEVHFNSTQMHYENSDKNNYGLTHSLSPLQVMSCDRSLSPRINIGRPPSPPLPYTPERDHFNPDSMLRRERSKRSQERSVHDRAPRPEHFIETHKMENFTSAPEPRSPDMQRFRSSDHSRHRMKELPIHYEERARRSGSPEYFENHYAFRSPSPPLRPYSPNHEQMPMSPPPNRDRSSPLIRDRPSHSSDRSRRRRSPPRRERSRDRRRRTSPRRRTPPSRSPTKRRNENGKSRTLSKNQESRRRDTRGRRNRRSQSKSKSSSQEQQLTSFQQPQPQPLYPPPPPGVVRLPPPPRPFPPGAMMIPMRPPPFPPPMGVWRPARPPMQAPPPSGWPYPRPRPFYYPY